MLTKINLFVFVFRLIMTMLSLFHLSMAAIVNCLMGNLENVKYKLQMLLDNHLPPWNRFKFALVSAVLEKLNSLMSGENFAPDKQRELIPILKLCIKIRQVLCWEADHMKEFLPDYCNDTMSKIMQSLNVEIKSQLISVLYEEEQMEPTVLHFFPCRRNTPVPLSFHSLLSKYAL